MDAGNLWNMGLAGVLASSFIAAHWYLVKTTIPAMLQSFRDEMKAEREQHAGELKEERDAHSAAVAKLDSRLGNVEAAVLQIAKGVPIPTAQPK